MSEAVLDAGPLIHLAELETLDVLADFDILRLPDAVWEEVSAHQRRALKYPGLRLQRVAAPLLSADLRILAQAFSLDRGETESLALMEIHPTSVFFTDDAAARLAAGQRGYQSHGTIGLLIRSVRIGRRTPDDVLKLFRSISGQSTLHIRPALMNKIIQRLENEWTRG